MDAQHEINVEKFACFCGDKGAENMKNNIDRALAVLEENFPNYKEFADRHEHYGLTDLLVSAIIFNNGGSIGHVWGDQWGVLRVTYYKDWIEWEEGDDDDAPDYKYKVTARIQFDRFMDGIIEAFLIYKDIDKYIEEYHAQPTL